MFPIQADRTGLNGVLSVFWFCSIFKKRMDYKSVMFFIGYK